jgi:nitrate/nitrite transporter NarK
MWLGATVVMHFTNEKQFVGFIISFLILFIAAARGSGSTFQMIPIIFPPKEAAAVLGFTAAFAAMVRSLFQNCSVGLPKIQVHRLQRFIFSSLFTLYL